MIVTEEMRRVGLLGIKSIQTTFPNGDNFFFSISRLADPLYCFTILIPIAAGLNTALATDMLMVSVMAEWSNTLLKWLLMDHRPFWWVQETNMYSKYTRPILRQTPLTCETGPGSPSGHVQGMSAVLYVVLKYLIDTYIVSNEKLSDFKKLYLRIIFWSLYLGLMVAVGISRLYTATHFPHQTLLGLFAGVFTAWLFVDKGRFSLTEYWHSASRLKMMMFGLIMIAVSFGAYWLQRLLGVDPQWSVRLAFKWCERPEWIHVSTTPLFSLVRCCGSMFGLALSAPISSSVSGLKCCPGQLTKIASVFAAYSMAIMLEDLISKSTKDVNITSFSVYFVLNAVEDISATDLVPGDMIVIPSHGCVMACDAVLLSGNCIVNESMLTGESVPVTKTPPQHTEEFYDPVDHKRHTLFSGTQVIQTRFYENNKVTAVVVRTGFATAKGELVRSILFPKPMSGFKFYQDSIKFVTFLFIIAALGMGYCIYLYIKRQASIVTVLLRTLDIITIVVPPALPAAMTAGTVYSQNRLKKLGIFCISPLRINVSGKVKLVCFDKTGTLTEDGLDLWGVLPVRDSKFYSEPIHDPSLLPVRTTFISTMATCHSLTLINGVLNGDPLDIKMFEATKWEMEEPGEDIRRYDMLSPTIVRPQEQLLKSEDEKQFELLAAGDVKIPYEIGIVRQFPFGSAIQCMSVIARTLGSEHMTLYTKGAPEKIKSLCSKDTVPDNFDGLLMQYTLSGYRVIALAYKDLDPKFNWKQAQRVNRDQLESDLKFLGLMIMQNTLKPETSPAISQLHLAKIRCVMVTGDNLLTAVSVARDCGMVAPYEHVIKLSVHGDPQQGILKRELIGAPQRISDTTLTPSTECVLPLMANSSWHFAVDGKTWAVLKTHHVDILPQIVTKGTIFARMSPDQKTQLVEILQSLDYIVAMCGDGANDCGALKAAHIGISLSEAEASVAAPFTSRVANITCVLKLIQEGRCALVTSFGIFKYMALYSLIQFITVLILYTRESILGNMQFLYIDLVITTSIAVVMGRTGPASRLVPKRPMGSLVSAANIIPLLLQVFLTMAVQLATLYYLMKQPWFEPISKEQDKEETVLCWENTSLFCVSSFQYIILAVVYSKGKPHRKPFYTNLLFLFTLLSLTSFTVLLLVYPVEPLAEFFELIPVLPRSEMFHFRLCLLAFPAVHLLASVFVETCIAETRWLKSLLHCLTRKSKPKNRYKQIDREITANSIWLQELST